MNGDSKLANFKFSHRQYALNSTAIIILLFMLGGLLSTSLEFLIDSEDTQISFSIYLQGMLQIIFLLLPSIYFAKRALLPVSTLFRLNKFPSGKQILYGIIGICAFQVFASTFMILQESIIPNEYLHYYKALENVIEGLYEKILGGQGVFDFTRALLIGAFIPAITEETLFRGFLQRSLEEEMPAIRAILITAIIFSFIHFNPIGLFPLLIIGIFLGFTAYATQSLALSMLLHFINNTFAIIIMFNFSLTEIEDKANDTAIEMVILLFILSFAIILRCIYQMLKYRNARNVLGE